MLEECEDFYLFLVLFSEESSRHKLEPAIFQNYSNILAKNNFREKIVKNA